MSVKKYGIYLAYPPRTDLRHEGIGRCLLSFLKAAATRSDISILVACPSWFREDLLALCKSEGIAENSFEILTPAGKPAVLRLYEIFLKYKHRLSKKEGRIKNIINILRGGIDHHRIWVERRLGASRSIAFVFLMLSYAAILQNTALLLYSIARLVNLLGANIRALSSRHARKIHGWNRLKSLLQHPNKEPLSLRLYHYMEERELDLMITQINKLTQINAWYSPTGFWPSFNRIQAPRLMCLPDMIIREFPVAFSNIGGERGLHNYKAIENAIQGATHISTYSKHVKWNTLVNRYQVNPDLVHVIPHAASDLGKWITVTEFIDNEATSSNYCMQLFRSVLHKSSNHDYTKSFMNGSVKFIFYASQFRPSKNILTLLRAYHHLLRKRYLGHKLILTGRQADLPEVNEYIRAHHLMNDVLCLHGLTDPELAACYKLADLAVNPSLSEGGFPFTFTEALSVGTPVVMARISVTEEIIQDNALREMMLFDPYDWKDMAQRIEWGLANRNLLLVAQQPVYGGLAQRSWDDVVNEHIEILDRISSNVINIPQRRKKVNLSVPDFKNLEKPLVLIHIPKTAGTAFINYLKSNMPSTSMIAPPFTSDLSAVDMNNPHFKLYWGHLDYRLLNERLRQACCVTFLRDPLARVISQYKSWHNPANLTKHWLSMMSSEQIEALRFSQIATIEEFILSDHPYIVANISDLQARLLSDFPNTPNMLESAINNLSERFYYFGIVERFSDSIDLFRRVFKNADSYQVPAIHENRSELAVNPLSHVALNRVRQLNRNDYALYDFAVRRFDEILAMEATAHVAN